jgi:hypothetical protein
VLDWAAVGAFLSGAGAIIGGLYALRHTRARAEAECEKRIAAFKEGLRWEEDSSE